MSFPYYVPIHVHTDFSLGDALLDVDDYVGWAKENNYPAIAVTDHGNLSASLYFNQVATKAGIKSLIGIEAYCTFRKEFDSEDKDEKRERDHFILLAKNYQGYLDLCWLLGQSMRNSFYYKPIILYEDLIQYNKNLIVSTACMGGRVPKLIMENKEKEAIEFINLMKKTFGDDFYLEMMEVQMADQTAFNQWAIRNYKRLGLKLIWTTDTHYFKPEHVEAHDAMKLINSKASFQDEGWQKRVYKSRNLWLKKREDIIEEAKALNYDLDVVNEALDNTIEIEQKIEKIKLTRAPEVIMPKFSDNSYEILENKVMDELVRRGWDKRPGYLERVKTELEVIKFKRMEDYFLIVADIVNYAENNDVMCGCGRGCFLPGSKVRLANKELKNIEEITEQEIIISGSQNKREVLEVYKYDIEEVVTKITLVTGETLGNGCTLDHLVKVIENSTEKETFIPAGKILPGDYLFDVDSGVLVKVQKTENFLYKGPVYDLNVDIDHTYNINGYAVHNSGAGSLVVCLLGITKIDPIKYDLYFERFLNVKRLDPPDIDLDFDSKTRYKIEIYLKEKYGINAVSHVISFGTFGIKNSIKDVFRVYFGTDKKDSIDRLSKCLEDDEDDFDEALKKMVSLEGKWAEDFIAEHKKQFDISRVLVGKIRHYSKHAGGVIIAPDSLEKFIPIMRIGDDITTGYPEGGDTRLITDAGLMKFDLLGLNACTIINGTLKQLPGLTVSSITENDSDPKVLEQFNKANTFTIFQFEGKNITKFVKRAKPTKFVDLVSINALYRPAVIQAGGLDMYLKNKENYDYEKAKSDPFERVLQDSYGLMCLSEETNISLNSLESEKIKNLKDKQQILSIEEFNKIQNGTIKKVWNTGKKECLLVTLSSGTQLVVTKDHRFLTAFGDKQVKDLQLCFKGIGNSGVMGDVLFEKWFISENNIDFDLMKIYLFGLTIGDGTFNIFSITFGSLEDAELIKKELEKIYGDTVNVKIKKGIRAYQVSTAKKIKNPNIRNPISQFHIDIYKDENFDYKDLRSENKFLPKFVFNLKEEGRVNLLRGLWDSDGCYINYSYKSISKSLIKDVAKLLSSLKISHYVREQYVYVVDVKRFMSFINKPFLINKRVKEVDNFVPVLRPVFNRILSERRNNTDIPKSKTKRRPNHNQNSDMLASLIRFYKSKKLINIKFFREIYEDTYKETYLGDTRPVFIENIEDFGEVNCYDIEMQNHNKPYYFANNVVSHNCFQESSMRVFQELGGFSLAEADESRHVFKLLFKGKSDHTDFDHMMAKFREGCHKNTNYDDKRIEEIMETMKSFSKYSFNKCISGNSKILVFKKIKCKKEGQPNACRFIICSIILSDLYRDVEKYSGIAMYDEVSKKSKMVPIKEVIKTGKKETYCVYVQSGGKKRIINATLDHKFLTPIGWKTLQELKVDDEVLVKRGKSVNVGENNAFHHSKGEIHNKGKKYKFTKPRVLHLPLDYSNRKRSEAALKRTVQGRTGKPFSKESIEKLRRATIRRFQEGKFPKTDTSINKKVFGFVSTLERHEFKKEFPIEFGVLDIAEPNLKIAIECQGTFFHADPRFYPDREKFSAIQRKNRRRDFLKRRWLKENGWTLLELWEEDINKNFELCKEQILSVLSDFQENPWEFKKIIAIEKFGIEETYDIHVDNPGHNYIANHFVVHNSHSCAYAMMAYIMMFLRTYHPTQYFASLLSNTDNAESVQDGKKINLFQHYAMTIQKDYGIKIHKPDVNTSGADFFRVTEDGGLMYALGHIKDVGGKAAADIQEKQPFTSFRDFLTRVTRRIVNKRVIKALIYAEALKFGDTQQVFEKEFKEKIDEVNFLQMQFAHTGLVVSKDLKQATDREYSLKGVEKAAAEGKYLTRKEAIPITVFISKYRRLAGNSKKTGKPYIMYFATLYDGSATIGDCMLNDAEKLGLEEGDLVKGKIYFTEAKNKKYSEHAFYLDNIQKIYNTEKYDGFAKYQDKEEIKESIQEEKMEVIKEPIKVEEKPKFISRKRLVIEQIEMPLEIKKQEPEPKQEVPVNKPKFISRRKIKTEQLELNLEVQKKEVIIKNKPKFISRKKIN